MVFSSLIFLICFLPVFLILYAICPGRYRCGLLLLGSLIFYAYGEPKYVILLIGSMAVNYGLSLQISRNSGKSRQARKVWLGISILLNLYILMIFKLTPGNIVLPLGVSFFTFQTMSYQIDLFWDRIEKEQSFLHFCTYVCMFPQLVAGPIVNYSEVQNELHSPKMTMEGVLSGAKTFIHGLVLKVLLADRLTILWNEIGKAGFDCVSTAVAWFGAISYSLQIYFDFYGYSLMAIGLGRMLGFELPRNFHLPYAATSIRDFYRRWHITLGRWFTQYVYIPMGGSHGSLSKTLFHLLVVWILTSAWHGIDLHFFLWGMSLFLCIAIEKCIEYRKNPARFRIYRNWSQKQAAERQDKEQTSSLKTQSVKSGNSVIETLKHLYVLLVIPITWMLFAIPKENQLFSYLGSMFGYAPNAYLTTGLFQKIFRQFGLLLLLSLFMATPLAERVIKKWNQKWIGNLIWALLFWVCVWYLITMGSNPFMYFRF